jgi:NitT/TauT family transport system permease protein
MTTSGELPKALEVSLGVMGAGYGVAILVGVPLGLLMGRIKTLETILEPYVNALFVAPRVALIPLILIWFGLGLKAQFFVIFLSCVFPILINAFAGARDVSASWVETVQSFGASRRQQFTEVVLPGSVPFIMTGLRLGIGHAVIGMVVGQMFLALTGLGELLVNYGDLFKTANIFGVVIVISLLGVVLTAAVRRLEGRFANWKVSERA